MKKNIFQKTFGFSLGGIPILPTLIGSFFLMSTMFMWYGSFFVDRFHPLMEIVEEQVTAEALGIWYAVGLVLSMAQGFGVALLLKWRNWPLLVGAVKTTGIAAGLLGLSGFMYPLVILPDHNLELFAINASGLITSWVLAAILITILRPRPVAAEVVEDAMWDAQNA